MEKLFTLSSDNCRYAYVRLGSPGKIPPLLLLSHFRADLGLWDPALLKRLAADREVIVADNRGIGLSGGTTPNTVAAMADGIAAFADSLGLTGIDVLGFSLGGYVAQALACARPDLVRRLILAGTSPRGSGEDLAAQGRVRSIITKDQVSPKDLVHLFFPPTPEGRARGVAYVRRAGPSAGVAEPSWRAQLEAAAAWGAPDPSAVRDLASITQPAFVAHGEGDIMVAAGKGAVLAEHLPHSTLKIYPGTGHGFLFHAYEEFGADVARFSAAEESRLVALPQEG
ncbi:alpha/beta hydrolase [Streptomyces niveiscabiei]|uniref:alpha/beta fold hydrolase n=1 Tax=Streptomyces niveiscabiei TaxID=164115 RepID=UPI0029B9A23A|nr:alpha/beta hydrolase [Streptomyces niveiscabiei]MDX3386191.1 alpha/beta hydrolase [Streptomyces niveiscabiei]